MALIWFSIMGFAVSKLLNLFVDICLLRAAPQDLPSSVFLMLVTALLGLLSGTVVIIDSFGSLGGALLAQLLDLGLMLGLLRAGLVAAGRGPRFLQTATALLGSGVFINLVTMPLQLLMRGGDAASSGGGVAGLLFLLLTFWVLLVIGHILRHAFEMRLSLGILIALGYFLLINWLVQTLFTLS